MASGDAAGPVSRSDFWRKRSRKVRKRLRLRREFVRMRLVGGTLALRGLPKVEEPNTIFSADEAHRLRGHAYRAAGSDLDLAERLTDPRGVRNWEYGVLLGALACHPERRSWELLDVGSGRSAFPGYLVASGNAAGVTTLDLPNPFERRSPQVDARDRSKGLRHLEGSMLEIPADDDSYDIVTCISAIEHLDGNPRPKGGAPVTGPAPYERYAADTTTALREMMRVVRPGGHLFLTTDAYLEDRQTTDAWNPPTPDGRIWSAYRFGDIKGVFAETLRGGGFKLVGEPDYRRALLEGDPDRATYRGRYFTTFAMFARRPPA